MPVRLSPQPAGRWRWLDVRTLVFTPRRADAGGDGVHRHHPRGDALRDGRRDGARRRRGPSPRRRSPPSAGSRTATPCGREPRDRHPVRPAHRPRGACCRTSGCAADGQRDPRPPGDGRGDRGGPDGARAGAARRHASTGSPCAPCSRCRTTREVQVRRPRRHALRGGAAAPRRIGPVVALSHLRAAAGGSAVRAAATPLPPGERRSTSGFSNPLDTAAVRPAWVRVEPAIPGMRVARARTWCS